MTTYYVSTDGDNTTDGTSTDMPWATIDHACSNVSAGDIINVVAGTYSETVTLDGTDGTSDNYITLQNYGTDIVIIDGGVDAPLKDLMGSHYWIIDGFTLEGKQGDNWTIEQYAGAFSNYWIFRNNTVKGTAFLYGSYQTWEDNEFDGSTNDGDGVGIREYSSNCNNNTIRGNHVHDYTGRGIWALLNCHDGIYEDNIIHDVGDIALDIDSAGTDHLCTGYVIRGNHIYDVSADGIEMENTSNCIVEKNWIHNTAFGGIVFVNYEDRLGDDVAATIRNNLLYGIQAWGGIFIKDCGGVDVYHNTVYNASDHSAVYIWDTDGSRCCDVNVRGNIAFQCGQGLLDYITTDCEFAITSCDHNITADPLFVNPTTDFTLKSGSPAINAAVDLGIYDDYASNPRPVGRNPDAGCYETSKWRKAPHKP